jgi:hypothetical protein
MSHVLPQIPPYGESLRAQKRGKKKKKEEEKWRVKGKRRPAKWNGVECLTYRRE